MAGQSIKKFEQGMEELRKIVFSLESGDLSLDESLALFEKGVFLCKSLSKKIGEAEKKLEKMKAELDAALSIGEDD